MSQINTNTIANELGTGGPDFVGMPTVGGDPVVESGSNSDGEWTRWADGTQHCKITSAFTTTDISWNSYGGLVVKSAIPLWIFPLSFVGNIPHCGFSAATFLTYRYTSSLSLSAFKPDLIREFAATYNDQPYSLFAAGRWK